MLGLLSSKSITRVAGRQAKLAFATRAASTLGGALDEAVERLPHKEAVRSIKQDIRWSFKEFHAYADELAHGFQDLSLEKGDVLAVWLPNNAENVRICVGNISLSFLIVGNSFGPVVFSQLVTQFAAAKAGLTLAVIDPKISTVDEIEHILHDSKASGILFEPKIAGRDNNAVIQELFPELATCTFETNAIPLLWGVAG